MIRLNEIAYTDCDVPQRYGKDIDACDTLEKLKERLAYWKPLAEDAYKLVQKMTEERFKEFVIARKKERRGQYSENDDAMVILMPMPMFKVSQLALHCHAPFGVALHRMIDEGLLNPPKGTQ